MQGALGHAAGLEQADLVGHGRGGLGGGRLHHVQVGHGRVLGRHHQVERRPDDQAGQGRPQPQPAPAAHRFFQHRQVHHGAEVLFVGHGLSRGQARAHGHRAGHTAKGAHRSWPSERSVPDRWAAWCGTKRPSPAIGTMPTVVSSGSGFTTTIPSIG